MLGCVESKFLRSTCMIRCLGSPGPTSTVMVSCTSTAAGCKRQRQGQQDGTGGVQTSVWEYKKVRGKYRSSVDAREPHNPTNSEEHQRHLQGVLYST
eukprot:1609050-Pyramimonas_sp.AAC.1